ncbi:MAG: response regulator [Acidobacteriaceae bacterium]|nr:response regulator [Acidobacteriaceae bacterium]
MKQRILVVDDDRLVADTLSQIYEVNGFDSVACYSAREGLEAARKHRPALVVCDVTMPEESGLVLAERLNNEMPLCQVLMFTAFASNVSQVHLQSLRLKRELRLLAKPCPPAELLRETYDMLQRKSA